MDWPTVAALVTAVGGVLVGIAQWRKSGREADKASADAAGALVTASGDVVKMLHDELDGLKARVDHLERSVGSWEEWADRVLSILDKAVGMLSDEERDGLRTDVEHARTTRPPHHYHQKNIRTK
jgi:hypothetical protein